MQHVTGGSVRVLTIVTDEAARVLRLVKGNEQALVSCFIRTQHMVQFLEGRPRQHKHGCIAREAIRLRIEPLRCHACELCAAVHRAATIVHTWSELIQRADRAAEPGRRWYRLCNVEVGVNVIGTSCERTTKRPSTADTHTSAHNERIRSAAPSQLQRERPRRRQPSRIPLTNRVVVLLRPTTAQL